MKTVDVSAVPAVGEAVMIDCRDVHADVKPFTVPGTVIRTPNAVDAPSDVQVKTGMTRAVPDCSMHMQLNVTGQPLSVDPFRMRLPDDTVPKITDYFNTKKQQKIPYPQVEMIDGSRLVTAIPNFSVNRSECAEALAGILSDVNTAYNDAAARLTRTEISPKDPANTRTIRSVSDIPVPEKPDFTEMMNAILKQAKAET